MAAITALLQFTQGATVGAPGQSIFGVAGTPVNVTSGGNNVGVVRAVFSLIWAPKKSALLVGVKQDTSAPALLLSAAFTPDVADAYVVRLDLYDAAGNVYSDTKIFGIKRPSGKFMPGLTSSPGQWNFAENISFDGTTFGYAKYANDFLEPQSWQTAFDQDFTLLPNQSLAGDGVHVVGGVSYVKARSADDRAALAIVAGAGLRFQPTAGLVGSILQLTLASILPVEVLQWATGLRLWMWIEAQNYAHANDQMILGLGTAAPFSVLYEGVSGNDGAGHGQQAAAVLALAGASSINVNANPAGASTNVTVLELPSVDGGVARVLTGAYGGGPWPAESTAIFPAANASSVTGNWPDPSAAPVPLANLGLILVPEADAASAALTITIGRIRVDFKV